jgi:hypothetical protein
MHMAAVAFEKVLCQVRPILTSGYNMAMRAQLGTYRLRAAAPFTR